MYIKFPTVTRLTYPTNHLEDQESNKTLITFRHNFLKKHPNKLEIIRIAEEFKIVKLPSKNDIINICSMPVHKK